MYVRLIDLCPEQQDAAEAHARAPSPQHLHHQLWRFFFTLVTGPRRSLSLQLSETRVYEPQIRARLGTTTHFCEVQDAAEAHARPPSPQHLHHQLWGLGYLAEMRSGCEESSYVRLIDLCITQF